MTVELTGASRRQMLNAASPSIHQPANCTLQSLIDNDAGECRASTASAEMGSAAASGARPRSEMLIGCAESAACPTIDLSSTGSVNALKSILIESFCDSMKRSRFGTGTPLSSSSSMT